MESIIKKMESLRGELQGLEMQIGQVAEDKKYCGPKGELHGPLQQPHPVICHLSNDQKCDGG
jgi:hypothetical protein